MNERAAIFGGLFFGITLIGLTMKAENMQTDILTAAKNTGQDVIDALAGWLRVASRPENAQYVAWAHEAEQQNGIPHNMIARLIYQESRYRQDIITGAVKSGAGAVGIMQIVPRWHPGVDPLNPQSAIFYGAQYLARLHRRFGNWTDALRAYNWGEGNVEKQIVEGGRIPAETLAYSDQIIGDLFGNIGKV